MKRSRYAESTLAQSVNRWSAAGASAGRRRVFRQPAAVDRPMLPSIIGDQPAKPRCACLSATQRLGREEPNWKEWPFASVEVLWANMAGGARRSGDDQPPAPAQLYNAKNLDRSISFEMLALNATTRGVSQSGEQSLAETQMLREQDF